MVCNRVLYAILIFLLGCYE